MPVDVSEAEYFDALSRLLDSADPCAIESSAFSSANRGKAALLAWVDDIWACSDRFWLDTTVLGTEWGDRGLGLAVLFGRFDHGRPVEHPRYREILAFRDAYAWCERESLTGFDKMVRTPPEGPEQGES